MAIKKKVANKAKKAEDPETEADVIEKEEPKEATVAIALTSEIVRPMISPKEAKANWQAYIELCNAILDPSDFTKMNNFQQGRGMVVKLFKNKSAWRKLATAFNLSYEIIKEERVDYPEYFVVKITTRVTAPNGRFVDGTGTCASNERKFAHVEHDVRAQAETRAKSRAISDMIGGGETSAEEMAQMEEAKKNACTVNHDQLPDKVVAPGSKNSGRHYHKCTKCNFWEWIDDVKEAKETVVEGEVAVS